MRKPVIDTYLWVRVLLSGPLSSFIFTAGLNNRFQVVTSIELLAELDTVWQRPRLHRNIDPQGAQELFHQLRHRSLLVDPHADDGLRAAMLVHGVAIWGIDTLRGRLSLED